MAYKIIRFSRKGSNRVVGKHYSLEQAQAHCSREDTHKVNKKTGEVEWFDGYTEE